MCSNQQNFPNLNIGEGGYLNSLKLYYELSRDFKKIFVITVGIIHIHGLLFYIKLNSVIIWIWIYRNNK